VLVHPSGHADLLPAQAPRVAATVARFYGLDQPPLARGPRRARGCSRVRFARGRACCCATRPIAPPGDPR